MEILGVIQTAVSTKPGLIRSSPSSLTSPSLLPTSEYTQSHPSTLDRLKYSCSTHSRKISEVELSMWAFNDSLDGQTEDQQDRQTNR